MIELDGEIWAKLYLGEVDLDEAIDANSVELKQRDKNGLVDIFAMFGRFEAAKNIKIPSPDDLIQR